MLNTSFRRLKKAALAQLLLLFLVILWGAYVRASGSGAGCGSHWPLCNGELVPRDPTVATFIEFTHRLTSGLSLVLCAYVFYLASKIKAQSKRCFEAAGLTFFFLILEALLGAGLVLLEHVGTNTSIYRVVSVSSHLVNTFFLLASALLCYYLSHFPHQSSIWPRGPMRAALGTGSLLVLLTSVLGAVTALGDTLFPVQKAGEALALSFTEGARFLERARVIHPFLAIFLGVYLLGLTAWLQRFKSLRTIAQALATLLLMQMALGFLNVQLLAPIWLQLVHLLFAQIVWLVLMLAIFVSASA